MLAIRVKCFNPYTNENVYKFFDWHEESGRRPRDTSRMR
jgi:hypothetical protein